MIIKRQSILDNVWREMDLNITEEQWADYQSGVLIQDSLVYLDDDEREFVLTGMTSEQWAELFQPDD